MSLKNEKSSNSEMNYACENQEPLWSHFFIDDIITTSNFQHAEKKVIYKVFVCVQNEFEKNPNPGACHLVSGILYILLKELGIDSVLCIGEAQYPGNPCFDHSWIEIEGKPIDIAIQLTLNEERNAPVYFGVDLDTGKQTKINYRFKKYGLDPVARSVNKLFLTEYMDSVPTYMGWSVVERIGKELGVNLRREDLRKRYRRTRRVLITP